MAKQILVELEETKNNLLQNFSVFTQEQVNISPFEGSWTAGQVAEHIVMFSSGALSALKANGKETVRNPEEKVKVLGDIFLNFNIKMQSPEFVKPSNDAKNKEELYNSLDHILAETLELARIKDLTATFAEFEFPTLGHLTRAEWLYFVLFHIQRHIRQLENIHNVLLSKAA